MVKHSNFEMQFNNEIFSKFCLNASHISLYSQYSHMVVYLNSDRVNVAKLQWSDESQNIQHKICIAHKLK